MRASRHIMVSAALGAVLYGVLHSAAAAAAGFASGIFLDLDHFWDYTANYGLRLRWRHFMSSFQRDIFKRIFVFFHAWEWVAALLFFAWRLGWPPILTGVLAGAGSHMLFDQFVNKHNPAAYFLIYRLAHGFDGRCFYGESEYRRRLETLQREAKPAPGALKLHSNCRR